MSEDPGPGWSWLNPFRSIALSMKANGPAAVVCVLAICIACIAIFGGPSSANAISALSVVLVMIVLGLARSGW